MSTSPASARPGTAAAAARRPRRAIIALAVAGALTGGGLVAVAPHASAATGATSANVGSANLGSVAVQAAKGYKSTVTLKVARKKTVVKHMSASKRPTYTVTATRSGKAVAGKAKLLVNGKSVSTRTLHKGKATFNPNWSMHKVGKNKMQIFVLPSSSKLRKVGTSAVTATAKRAGSPVVAIAKTKVGARYVSGATGPSSFDCSGFTSYVYKKAIGKKLPRTSSAQKHVGKKVSRKNAKPGDLIWSPGHVAIYIGNGKQIDAGNPRVGVVKRSIWQSNPTFIRVSSKAV
ncbi:C40 family peptidase [Isoptericola sp. NPDC056573]|uniref:C40 family peptidase n=1 Tax=unclassified Isoptericola TaxID=2623355 RepID=UPI0036BA24B3